MMPKPSVLAYVPDLMFAVRVRDVLEQSGYLPLMVDSLSQAETELFTELALVIVDLRGSVEAMTSFVQAVKATDPMLPVLAFGSHVDVARQQAARDAGCDRVVANSKFSSDLPLLIQAMAR